MQLALLTHGKLLDLMPPEKRGSELLAAVQCVATSLRSIDEIEGPPQATPSIHKLCTSQCPAL